MKTIKNNMKKITFFLMMLMTSLVAFAQDKTADVSLNVTETSKTWYSQPWMWVVGGAVFVIILVAILRGGKKD